MRGRMIALKTNIRGARTQETAKALAAFERYWAMGPMRSLRKLAEEDTGQKQDKSRTDSHFDQLGKWSSQHNWQARVKQRVMEEAELARDQNRERADRHRQRLLTAIEDDSSRLLKRLQESPDELLADDALALERMTKLYFQLAEQPLVDSHEIGGKGGGPIAAEFTILTEASLALMERREGLDTDAGAEATEG